MNKRVEQLCSEFDERVSRVGVGMARVEVSKRLAELEAENERLCYNRDLAIKFLAMPQPDESNDIAFVDDKAANGGEGE